MGHSLWTMRTRSGDLIVCRHRRNVVVGGLSALSAVSRTYVLVRTSLDTNI